MGGKQATHQTNWCHEDGDWRKRSHHQRTEDRAGLFHSVGYEESVGVCEDSGRGSGGKDKVGNLVLKKAREQYLIKMAEMENQLEKELEGKYEL